MTEWLDEILISTSEAESPTSFIAWASICAISAVAGRRISINRGGVYTLFPNIYVLIVGPPGIGKSFPARLAKRLVQAVNNTRTISGQNTIQGVISDLKKPYTKGRADNPLTDAHAFLQSGEFSNLIMGDPTSLTLLTEWYDTHEHDEWRKKLRDDEIVLNNLCVTMLGATNEKLFRDRILDKDIEGGFMARCLVVHETKRSKINSLVDEDEPHPDIDIAALAGRLKEIAALEGGFKWTRPAGMAFNGWYHNWMTEPHPWDRVGISFRVPDHIIKVAMCVSLSRRNDLLIKEEDLGKAFELVMPLIRNSDLIIRGKGKSPVGELVAVFFATLTAAPGFKITRSQFLRENYADFDTTSLDEVVKISDESGWIEQYMEGSERWYKLKDEWAEKYKEIKGENGE